MNVKMNDTGILIVSATNSEDAIKLKEWLRINESCIHNYGIEVDYELNEPTTKSDTSEANLTIPVVSNNDGGMAICLDCEYNKDSSKFEHYCKNCKAGSNFKQID